MASHFPSIEDFDPSLDEQLNTSDSNPNLDFIKREQEALGGFFEGDASAFPDLMESTEDNAATTEFERSFPALDDQVQCLSMP